MASVNLDANSNGFTEIDELPLVLTAQQAADFLQVSVNTLKKLCQQGEVPAKKLGGMWRIDKQELLDYIRKESEEKTRASGPDTWDGSIEVGKLTADIRKAAELLAFSGQDNELIIRLLRHAHSLENRNAIN